MATRQSSAKAPILALLLLAPLIGEVLPGATRLSYLFVLIPEIMVWGCAALLIREAVRRRGGGWPNILALGLALAVAEEFVIQQTSLAPLAWAAADKSYGRFFGVNWVWLLAMLGFESVWVAAVPIQLTELLVQDRRGELWLRRRGMAIAGAVFCLGSFIAWFAWTQHARTDVFHAPQYTPPLASILVGVAIVVILTVAGLSWPIRRTGTGRFHAPWPALTGAVAFILAAGWFFLIGIAYGSMPNLPVWIPLAGGVAWAAAAFAGVWTCSAAPGWNDRHRFSVVFATVAAAFGAALTAKGWKTSDLIIDIMLGVMSLAGLTLLARRIRARVSNLEFANKVGQRQ